MTTEPSTNEHPEAELQECFECGAVIAPEAPHGVSVTEGVILCPDCCTARHPDSVKWQMPSWYEDLSTDGHHT